MHLMRLLRGLAARGWAVTLATPAEGPLRSQAREAGWATEELALGGLGPGQGARAVLSWPRARRVARGADVLYLGGGVCGRLLPALAGLGPRPRIVLHIHDMVAGVPRPWHRADLVLADSKAVADRLPGLPVEVVYGPVELDPPESPAPWTTDGGPVVGYVGRVEPRKGVIDLVRAAPLIRRVAPEVRVMIVGDDPYGSDPAYTREILSSPEVEHHGWVENAPGLMRHLDVLVLPSHEEPFGTVLAEAMAVGTPVVATRVDGLPEVVRDGVTGRLVAPGDPPALAEAVLEVLAHREEFGRAARQEARRFDAGTYVAAVEALIAA
mgnify:CR=1 FL=1